MKIKSINAVRSDDKKYSYLKSAKMEIALIRCVIWFVFILVVVSSVCIVISIYFENKYGTSCYEHFNGPRVPIFLLSPAIYEVIQVIGFSSLLIGFIYAHYDKELLGVTYSEIFKRVFILYDFFSIVHIIAVLFCYATAKTEFTESAMLALIVVFFCSIYQFYTIRNSILNKNNLIKFAYILWNERSQKDISVIDTYLRCLAEKIPSKGDLFFDEFIDNFAVLFASYPTKGGKIKQISNVWGLFLSNPNVENNQNSSEELFAKLVECLSNRKKFNCPEVCLCKLACGYIVSEVKRISEINEDDYLNLETFLQDIDICKYNLLTRPMTEEQIKLVNEMFDCIFTNMYLLIWMYFQFDKIKLSKDLFKNTPRNINYIYIDEILDVLIKPICDDETYFESCLKVAKSQIIKQ